MAEETPLIPVKPNSISSLSEAVRHGLQESRASSTINEFDAIKININIDARLDKMIMLSTYRRYFEGIQLKPKMQIMGNSIIKMR
ncbi:uncharacterized protein Bfra_006303 [Botrytis fragariae]|uniref:Uncharacterized protein n=1 Tax=Botrytis fragariae TaxID=1964551 RepID=A0A8H6B453_9HELO|nr:uncharacterized protein Bfra_006303 [Botrytis fragariae]KAF5879098.1 hypothetical protein Bfra_006303 [Botrytis fragariae]